MNKDIAMSVAATSVEELSRDDAATIVAAFLAELTRCAVCDGSHKLTFAHDLHIEGSDDRGADQTVMVRSGSESPCPRCGPADFANGESGDPDWVQWLCTGDDSRDRCGPRHTAKNDRHGDCGWRIVLPRDFLNPTDQQSE